MSKLGSLSLFFKLINKCHNIKNVGSCQYIPIFNQQLIRMKSDISKDIDISSKKPMSRAMKAYLERARAHDEFLHQQNIEFQIGRRHLANMMGEDPNTFTQDDINNAISYLFPSGLYDSKARPIMRPPEEIFPQKKAAEFDESGRPHHFLFYTGKPNFYQLLYDIVNNMQKLNSIEDSMIKQQIQPDLTKFFDLSGSSWISQEKLEKILVEKITEKEYNNFLVAIERLVKHPYSYQISDFIQKFRVFLMSEVKTSEIPKLKYNEDGKAYVTTYECLRKTARAHVTVSAPGVGQITINGNDISYFKDMQCREQLLFPLIFTGMNKVVDVDAHVEGGGPSGQAGAIRWGIAMSLRSFVDQDTLEKMKLAGLLQRDYRKRERKKPGQKKARRKFTWKKR